MYIVALCSKLLGFFSSEYEYLKLVLTKSICNHCLHLICVRLHTELLYFVFNSEYMYSLCTHVMLKWLSITEDALFEVLVQAPRS